MSEVHTELSRMCITGGEPEETIGRIAEKLNTAKHNAGRLVMTEAAYFGSVSQKDCFHDLGVEKYEICAVQDSHTSSICQEMDGRVFDMKDYEAGVTAPPFHVFCRSTTAPYFDDEFTAGQLREIYGEGSKAYQIPAEMKYLEWKKMFVGNDSKAELWKQNMIDKAKQEYPSGLQILTGNNPLNDDDIYALHRYMSSESYLLNKKLRKHLTLTDDERSLIKSIDSAILKLPEYKGEVYRALSLQMIDSLDDFNEKHQEGFPIRYNAYTSTGASVYDESMEIQLIIKSRTGRDMRSFNKSEQEIIFKRGSLFYITKRKGNTIWMIEV